MAVLLATMPGSGEAVARTCAPEPVTARGEPARFTWQARTQARANWRRKVRSISALGVDYADWGHAAEASERCITTESFVYCIFTGRPCLK